MENNLVLNLPFDEPVGTGVAYDYSSGRHDGTIVSPAEITKDAIHGNGLALNGGGDCNLLGVSNIFDGGDFTVTLYVKLQSERLGYIINYSGLDSYEEDWVDVPRGKWLFVAMVKSHSTFTMYIDGVRVSRKLLTDTPVGLSLSDEQIMTYAIIDDVKVYHEAKTLAQVLEMYNNEHDVEYYVDGVNFKEYGVYVSASSGIMGALERKESLTIDYDDYHGEFVDKSRPRYKKRTIKLECFIEALSKESFINWVNMFMDLFRKPGNQRLKIDVGSSKPLLYEVNIAKGSDVDKKWPYDDELMVGKFKLELEETEPVKRVLRHIATTANSTGGFACKTTKQLNVYWGDGTHSYNLSGNNLVASHTYAAPGEYDIIITGVIEDIQNFSTNDIILWEKLQ